MEQVRSLHFVHEHENGATKIVRGIEMTRAEGDIDGSTRLQVEVEGSFGPFSFKVGIVILPGESWIQNPITERWERDRAERRRVRELEASLEAASGGR